jgi:hypothetical protein
MRHFFAMAAIAMALTSLSCDAYEYDDSPRIGRAASGLERYRSMMLAAKEGYILDMTDRQTDYFVPGRGVEVKNPKYTALDVDKPQSLLYEFGIAKCQELECPDEGFVLVGVRYTVPANGQPPPQLLGQTFTGPVDDPPVYELISWIKDNPNGKHASTHPSLYAPEWWPEHFRTWRDLANKYPTPDAAKAGGYEFMFAERPDGTLADCVYNRNGFGTMGYHWMRIEMISRDPASIIPTAPAGLLYFQREDRQWVLGGLEYLLWAARQPTPKLYGYDFDGPMGGHQRTQPEHFDLHTYPGYLNPDGVFTTWNSAAGCPLSK